MTWTYTYHRFTNRAAFDAACDAAGFQRVDGQIAPPETVSLDVVGVMWTGGEYDSRGNVTKPPTLVPGYHVNAAWSVEVPGAFKASLIVPASPRRTFA